MKRKGHEAIRLIGLILFFSAARAVQAQSAEDVATQIHERYDEMTAMRASFSQVTTSTYLDEPERVSGSILLAGDRYLIVTDQQTIVTDTEHTWVYNRYENQVLLNDYEEDPSTFSLSGFLTEFDSDYSLGDSRRVDNLDVLSLTPLDPLSAFRTVTIWAEEGVVVRLDILDMNDVEMHFELTDIEFNPVFPEDSFLFSVPQGAEVIDLREN